MADTTTPGYLLPLDGDPAYDDDLLDLLQPVIAGVTGLPGNLVRPAYQAKDAPELPDYGIDWVSIAVPRTHSDNFAHQAHAADAFGGYDTVGMAEEFDLLCSFFGPGAGRNAARARHGMVLGQNRVALRTANTDLIAVGDSIFLPALLTGVWSKRVDVTFAMRRYVVARYAVRTVVKADLAAGNGNGIDNGQYVTPIVVGPPT